MAKTALAYEEMLAEIEELKKSPYVKIAKKAEYNAMRQKLYQLRSLDRKGRKIVETSNGSIE